MWKGFVLLFFFVLGGAAVAATYEIHVVRSDEGFLVIPKEADGLKDVYADIREWDVKEWRNHSGLMKALITNGHQDLVKQSIYQDVINNFMGNGNAAHVKQEVQRE